MTVTVNTIEGRRGSACVNDAFSVVANGTDLIDIIPTGDIPGKTYEDVLQAFTEASQEGRHPLAVKALGRHALGLRL